MIVKVFRSMLSFSVVLITVICGIAGMMTYSAIGAVVGGLLGFFVSSLIVGYHLTVVENRDINEKNQHLLEKILESLEKRNLT